MPTNIPVLLTSAVWQGTFCSCHHVQVSRSSRSASPPRLRKGGSMMRSAGMSTSGSRSGGRGGGEVTTLSHLGVFGDAGHVAFRTGGRPARRVSLMPRRPGSGAGRTVSNTEAPISAQLTDRESLPPSPFEVGRRTPVCCCSFSAPCALPLHMVPNHTTTHAEVHHWTHPSPHLLASQPHPGVQSR